MKFFGFLFLLHLFLNKGNSVILSIEYYDVIKSVLAHYQSRSAVLIYDGSGKQWEMADMVAYLNLQKLISYNFYFSSLTTLPILSKALRNGRLGLKETVAALEFNENIIHVLLKASNESAMASYKWFFTSSSASENLDKLTIPSDCEFIIAHGNPEEGYEVSETYNVDRNRKLKKRLGRWTTGHKLQLNASLDLFTRRQNFEGAVIKIASPKKDACLYASFSTGVAMYVYCIYQTIWELMAEMLNVKLTLFSSVSGRHFSHDPLRHFPVDLRVLLPSSIDTSLQLLSSWKRILLITNDSGTRRGSDISIIPNISPTFIEKSDTEFTFRSTPMNSMDLNTRSYVWPVFGTRVVVVTSYIVQKVEWKTYILPFSTEMWIIVLVWVVACDLILTVFELIANEMKRGNFFSLYCSEFSFAAAFTVCNQGVLGPSKLTGVRIIFTMMFVVPAVLFPGYSAILTSFLTVQLHKKPFQSLEELSRLKEYKMGWHNTFARQHLFNLEDKSPLNVALLTNNVLPDNKLPASDVESIERLCKEKFVVLINRDTVLALKPKCSYYMLKQPFKIIFTGMEIKKNSWYKYYMDRCERRLHFAGLLDRIIVHAIMKHLDYYNAFFVEKESFKPIKMESIILPFAVLFLGVVCSGFLLGLEIICSKQNSTRGQRQRRFKRVKKIWM